MNDQRITARELRIGNWIAGSKGTAMPNDFQVEAWHISAMFEFEKTGRRFVDWKALPLNEEWLLKFGCESIGELHPTFKLKNYIIEASLLREYWILRQIINKEDSLWIADMRCVHNFQNIYFDLKGEELTIKETASWQIGS